MDTIEQSYTRTKQLFSTHRFSMISQLRSIGYSLTDYFVLIGITKNNAIILVHDVKMCLNWLIRPMKLIHSGLVVFKAATLMNWKSNFKASLRFSVKLLYTMKVTQLTMYIIVSCYTIDPNVLATFVFPFSIQVIECATYPYFCLLTRKF